MNGKVYLVGAGPGDPELLTVKGLRLLKTADAVLHDDLVSPEILKLIPTTAQVHNVGKRCGKKTIVQEEINFLMVALAQAGLRVIRLKSGDPLIFGRAGEEAESLRRAGIAFEIVPGVTSALGAAAAAQIPLTHRHASSALVFITAHQSSGSEAANWNKLAGSGATLVIYMPGQNYSEVAWKALNNIDPERDIEFVKGPVDSLDHSSRLPNFGSKMGIDATRKWPGEGFTRPWPSVIEMSQDVKRRVDELWKKAGL